MKKVILFLTLVPCIAFGQITSGTDNFQQPVKEFSELSIENRTAWVDTSVEYCYYNWNLAAGNWDPNIAKLIYTYDLDGNLIEFLYMILDAGIWVIDSRYIYTYDGSGNLIETILQNWDGSSWVDDWKGTYTYDSSDNLIEGMGQNWDGSTWVDNWRGTYSYDGNGNQDEQVNELWDGSMWVVSTRSTFSYDGNGNMVESIAQDWDGSDWVNNAKGIYAYDGNGNQIEQVNQLWDGSGWVNSRRISYVFISGNNLVEQITQYWDGSNWVNWFRIALCDYPAVISELYYSGISLFPNPATDHLIIEAEKPSTLYLFNAQGKLLISQEINQSQTLNTANFSKGIYLLKAINERGVFSQKVIKQ